MLDLHLNRSLILVIALFTSSFITGCELKPSAATTPETKRILVNDSGYITKRQAYPFLTSIGLSNTPGGFWFKELVSDNDTVGKYYRSNERGHYIVLIRAFCKTDSSETLILAYLKSDGKLLAYRSYGSLDYHCHKDAVTSFCKVGKYFMLWGCEYGSGYGSTWAYVFESMPKDELSKIFFGCFSTMGMDNPEYPQQLKSVMELTDSGILMHYTLNTGRWGAVGIVWRVVQKADVDFAMRNGDWVASDSSILQKVEIY